MNSKEMHRTFNMGMGMVVAVSNDSADSVLRWISDRIEGAKIVGSVTDRGRLVTHVDSSVMFDSY